MFINLLVNAAQSIAEGDVEDNEVRVSTLTDERGNVVVEVADAGSGIAPEALPRLFEAFYTSKLPGAGTGLGLSISQATIEALGGAIRSPALPASGARFVSRSPHLPMSRAHPRFRRASSPSCDERRTCSSSTTRRS